MLSESQKLEISILKQKLISDGIDSLSISHKIRNRKNVLKRKNRKNYGTVNENIVRGNNTSIHHIFPQSKYKGFINNTVRINNKLHEKYHLLFDNKDPYEILDYLVNYFWDGNNKLIENYLCSKSEIK